MTKPQQLEIANEAIQKGLFQRAEIEGEFLVLDGWVSISSIEMDKEVKSIKGTQKTRVLGFNVDVATGDDAVDVGQYESFFEAMKSAANVVAGQKIDQIGENWGITQMLEDEKNTAEFLAANPGYLYQK